jgi:heme a synthase
MLDAKTFNPESTGSIELNPARITSLRRLVWKIAIATWLLMAVGSATRVMNAGLACPDWPLCYGQLVPSQQMNLQVFLEWFHRADAGAIGLSALWLVFQSWYHRQQLPSWLPWASSLALLLILLQGGLGALTVTELLRFDLVSAHLGTALIFFCTLLIIATSLLPSPSINAKSPRWLLGMGVVAAIAIYLQSILGALVGSQWALHLCFSNGERCSVMNAHLIGVIPATLTTFALIVALWFAPSHQRPSAIAIALLLSLQILLGYATYKLHLQVEPLTVCHQAIGAALLGAIVVSTTNLARVKII